MAGKRISIEGMTLDELRLRAGAAVQLISALRRILGSLEVLAEHEPPAAADAPSLAEPDFFDRAATILSEGLSTLERLVPGLVTLPSSWRPGRRLAPGELEAMASYIRCLDEQGAARSREQAAVGERMEKLNLLRHVDKELFLLRRHMLSLVEIYERGLRARLPLLPARRLPDEMN